LEPRSRSGSGSAMPLALLVTVMYSPVRSREHLRGGRRRGTAPALDGVNLLDGR
jgi:hypothetical protein